MSAQASRSRRALRLVVQGLGFLIGLALLGWCVRAALSPENREQLQRLGEADPADVALLMALSAGTLILNGLFFWSALRPARRIRIADHLAVNALCSFLAFLPFKLGALTRVAINNRRDRVPLFTIGAWYGAILVVMVAIYAPAMGASLWRRGVDAVWWVSVLGGSLLACAAVVAVARQFAGERGLVRLHRLLDGARLPGLGALGRTERFAQLHAGATMLASPVDVFAAGAMRAADLAIMSARFVVAGAIVGHHFGWEQAVLVASAYYIIGVVSPTGMLGAREAGTVWMAGALGLAGGGAQSAEEVARSLTVLTLFITGTESIVLLAGAAAGVAWLRPDRLLRRTSDLAAESAEGAEGSRTS
jgi:hypothetical protein